MGAEKTLIPPTRFLNFYLILIFDYFEKKTVQFISQNLKKLKSKRKNKIASNSI